MTSQMLPRDLSNADEEGTGVLSAATIARQMQDLGFMVDATQVDSMARDAGAVVGDSNDIIYGQLLSFIYGNGAVVDQQSGANADTVAIAQMLNSLDSGNRCAFVGLVQDGAVYSKARLDERIRNSPGQEQGYESLSEPAATNAVAASVASSAAADSDDELVE